MGLAKISTLTSTPLGILLIFYTDGGCWQFRVLTSGGAVFGEQKLYYTTQAAEKAGQFMGTRTITTRLNRLRR